MDIAISCFVELFDLEHDYTTTLEDFGHYFLEHERLMAHWRRALPIPIHEVCYEQLVADPEPICRSLIAYCGLDWNPACLAFHKTERTVQTPSRWQVRQPVYQSSVGRWRRYQQHMAGLEQLLNAAGFQYAPGKHACDLPQPTYRHGTKWHTPPNSLTNPIFIVAAPRSGSTLLFETLARSAGLCSVGGEAHWLIENHAELRPGATGVESNRLTADHATPRFRESVIQQIVDRLIDCDGNAIDAHDHRVFLEKTPKNALRIPFFDRIFPASRFVFLWRDPRENISSIIEAWRSGHFRTYKQLAGFDGPWSLLLPPGYRQYRNRPLEEIATFQWECTNRNIIDDLQALSRDRWLVVCYRDLIAEPASTVQRILDFANIEMDPALAAHLRGPLPHSRYTQTAPDAEKWRRNAAEIERVLSAVEGTWRRLRTL